MVSNRLTTLAFDADDTLWHNEVYFLLTQKRVEALLAPYCDKTSFNKRLLETERRNIGIYGYGVKGFTLSVIEVAIELSEGKVPATAISEIISGGRDLLAHPLELLPGVEAVLRGLKGYRFVLITKGDLLHQEEKLAASGLGELFDSVHVVSEKNEGTYRRILRDAEHTMMIGNSMRSDIVPALAAGAYATHIPFEIEWELERADDPKGEPRFARIENMAALPQLLAQFS
ncbi:MAG: HAD family hydrolase [Rhodobacteraceae bacterium]|nr:HAD family hydrolase [Paracoccaceae bacterium]